VPVLQRGAALALGYPSIPFKGAVSVIVCKSNDKQRTTTTGREEDN
jgi:hypothetical protein